MKLQVLKNFQQLIEHINGAANTADDFTKLYYEHRDKRKTMKGLYMSNGLLVFNGNGVTGDTEIASYLQKLPPAEHQITTLDAQPIIDSNAGKTILIQTSGLVRFDNQKSSKAFQQSFLITACSTSDGIKWKIVTDTFRLQDGICGEIKI